MSLVFITTIAIEAKKRKPKLTNQGQKSLTFFPQFLHDKQSHENVASFLHKRRYLSWVWQAMEECSCQWKKSQKMVAALGIPIILCVTYNSDHPLCCLCWNNYIWFDFDSFEKVPCWTKYYNKKVNPDTVLSPNAKNLRINLDVFESVQSELILKF